jgi:predicted ATP-binding protein involved in virulence
MHLKRVRVPDFRVLKDIDITFEQDLVPRIFPLGSLNGGGKSTLLQLIFTLLHCCGNKERIPYLQNMLDGFEIDNESGKRDLASIEIIVNNEVLELNFFCCTLDYVSQEIEWPNSEKEGNPIFSRWVDGNRELRRDIDEYQKNIDEFRSLLNTCVDDPIMADSYKEEAITVLSNLSHLKTIRKLPSNLVVAQDGTARNEYFSAIDNFQDVIRSETQGSTARIKRILQHVAEEIHKKIKDFLRDEDKAADYYLDEIQSGWLKRNYIYACGFGLNQQDNKFLFCKFNGFSYKRFKHLIEDVTQNIFLAAPITQVFRFIDRSNRELLYRGKGESYKYYSQLEDTKSTLSGLFAYDFLAVDLLIKAFVTAMDEDRKMVISTGEYGQSYQQLRNEVGLMLVDKQVNLDLDLAGVTFSKVDSNGDKIELYPEDLSHGELKRLSLYMWLKFNKIENAIVLMDEVEIALHPDWQYQIVNDLQTWAPNNQYILATHSHELCQALTPAHVKEIEPKLIKK